MAAMSERCCVNSAAQFAQDPTCARIAGAGSAPVMAASISAGLYFSHSIATSPLIVSLLRTGATLRCRSAGRAFARHRRADALPSPRATGRDDAWAPALQRRDQDAPEIRSTRLGPRWYPAGADEPTGFRAARGDSTNARDRARG